MRLSGRKKLGFFPLPPAEGDKISNLLQFGVEPASVIDPCVGTGAALQQITRGGNGRLYGIELDAARAAAAAAAGITTVHGSTFDTHSKVERFSLLYLNPPYDSEIGTLSNRRMEELFLGHTFRWLRVGGVLVLVIPFEHAADAQPAEGVAKEKFFDTSVRGDSHLLVVWQSEVEQRESLDLAVRVEGAVMNGGDARGRGRGGARSIELDAIETGIAPLVTVAVQRRCQRKDQLRSLVRRELEKVAELVALGGRKTGKIRVFTSREAQIFLQVTWVLRVRRARYAACTSYKGMGSVRPVNSANVDGRSATGCLPVSKSCCGPRE